jgi:hypothetical protein
MPCVCPIGGKAAAQTRKGKALRFAVSPCPSRCRRQDLNLHWVNPNQALNLVPRHFKHVGPARGLRCNPLNPFEKRSIHPCICILGTLGLQGQCCPQFVPKSTAPGLLPGAVCGQCRCDQTRDGVPAELADVPAKMLGHWRDVELARSALCSAWSSAACGAKDANRRRACVGIASLVFQLPAPYDSGGWGNAPHPSK